MRHTTIFLLFIVSIGSLAGQLRSGQFTLTGDSELRNRVLAFGVGYFPTERLLIKLAYENDAFDTGNIIRPSLRYAFATGEKWRPYIEGEISLFTGTRYEFLRNAAISVGVDREIIEGVLLNVFAFANRNRTFENVNFGIKGKFDALLGGTAGRPAASKKIRSGGLAIGSQPLMINFINRREGSELSVTVNPELSILLSSYDQLNVEVQAGYRIAEQRNNSQILPETSYSWNMNAGVDVGYRRYLLVPALFNPYAEAFAGYGARVNTSNRNGDRARSVFYGGSCGAKCGAVVFIAPAVSLEANLVLQRWFNTNLSGVVVFLGSGLRFWLK